MIGQCPKELGGCGVHRKPIRKIGKFYQGRCGTCDIDFMYVDGKPEILKLFKMPRDIEKRIYNFQFGSNNEEKLQATVYELSGRYPEWDHDQIFHAAVNMINN